MNSASIYSAERTARLPTVRELQQELAELRAAAQVYFAQSDLITLTREGVEAADQLARLLKGTDAA
jgi:hypothetical protein